MKKSKNVILIIAPILGTVILGCGESETFTTRDVYQSREDCLKDWSEADLCEQMNDNDSDGYRRNGGVFVAGSRPFWGPNYNPNDRAVTYKGRTIMPSGRSTTMSPFRVSSRSSSPTSRSSVSSPRGGFGSSSSSGS